MAANFENFKIFPDFPINSRKSHQVSKNYLKSSESYGQKPLRGVPKDPPGLNRVKEKSSMLDIKTNYQNENVKCYLCCVSHGTFITSLPI